MIMRVQSRQDDKSNRDGRNRNGNSWIHSKKVKVYRTLCFLGHKNEQQESFRAKSQVWAFAIGLMMVHTAKYES